MDGEAAQGLELHLTTAALAEAALPGFIAACAALACRPLLIELARGAHRQQPMATRHCPRDLTQARQIAHRLRDAFAAAGYPITREKLEAPLDWQPAPGETSLYYEWHGKLALRDEPALLALCAEHGAHLSRNALRGDAGSRFVTLRETAGKARFLARLQALTTALTEAGRTLLKAESELCLHDTNLTLDYGWLTVLDDTNA